MKRAEQVTLLGKIRSGHIVLAGEPGGKRPLGDYTKLDLHEIGCCDVEGLWLRPGSGGSHK